MPHMPTTDEPDGAPAVPNTRAINATFPIRIDGGASGDLSADRTVSLADTAGARLLGALTAGSPSYLTGTQVTTLIDLATSLLKGAMPALSGNVDDALRGNGTWGTVVSGYVTPEQHGAVGDGVTNDRLAIMDAVDAALALGGLAALKFGAGKTYYISSAVYIEGCRGLQVWGNNSEILFPSDDLTITATDGEHAASNRRSGFYVRNTQDVTIRDVRFRGTGTDSVGVSDGCGSAIYARRTVGLRITNCQHELGGSLYQQDAVADTTGTGDSLAVSGSTVTLADAAGAFHGGMVGMAIFLSGCSNGLNNGQGRITAVASATSLTYTALQSANETSSFTYTIPDGDRNTVLDSCISRDARFYCSVAGVNTTFRGCRFEWNLSHIDMCGVGDSLAISGTTVTLTDASAKFRPYMHGKPITIQSATSPANDVTALCTYISSTQVSFTNAAGVTEQFTGGWHVMGGERVGTGAGVGALSFDGVDTMTITATSAVFKTTDVGRGIHIGNSTTADNEGVWCLTEVVSSTVAKFGNASGASEDFSGFFTIDTWDRAVDSVTHGSTHAIYAFAGRTDIKVLGCSFSGNRATAIKTSGSSLPVGQMLVDGCTFYECGEVFQFGADDVQDHTGCSFINNFIVDCAIDRPAWATGALVNILGSRGVRIQSNTILYTHEHSSEFDDTGNLAGATGIKVERYFGSSQGVDDVLIADNKFLVDRKSARSARQLQTAILLEQVGIQSKWGNGTLTKSGSTMTLTDSNGYFSAADDINKSFTIVNAPDAGNNGTFVVLTVPNRQTLTFVNAGGVGGGVSAGTYRMYGRSNAGSVVIERNYFTECCTVAIGTTNCVGPEVRYNHFQNSGVAYWTLGDVSPRCHGNRLLTSSTLSASFYIGDTGGARTSAWPIFYDNIPTNPTAGFMVGGATNRDIGIGVGGGTRCDYPLKGKQGKVRPTGGYEEVVIAYGDLHVDGDLIGIDFGGANTFTYKSSAPGAGQFSTFAELLTLINGIANLSADDYGTDFASGAVATQHIRIRRDVQSTSDGNFTVESSTLNPTALVVLCNDSVGHNDRALSRGSASAGPIADKTVVWSPMCSWTGITVLVPDNVEGRTALAGGPAMHVKNQYDAGCCEVMQHDEVVADEEFRFLLGGN